jgi:hypothetical protein
VPVTREQFAVDVLHGLGIEPTRHNVRAMVGWARIEGGHFNNDARFNLLNTTLRKPGLSTFRSVGKGAADIRIYRNYGQGVQATVDTLKLPAYRGIRRALRGGSADQVAQAIGSSPWGTSAAGVMGAIRGTPVPKHLPRGGAVDGGGGGGAQVTVGPTQVTPGRAAVPALGDILGPLREQLAQGQAQAPAISAPAAPTFAAHPVFAGGFTPAAATGAAPASSIGSDVGSALQEIQQSIDTSIPAGQPQVAPGAVSVSQGSPAGAGGLGSGQGGKGRVVVAPGANAHGKGLQPIVLRSLDALSAALGRTVRVGTGTNHSYLTTSGNVSEHVTGNAADLPMVGQQLTKTLATALFVYGRGKTVQWLQNGGGSRNVKVTRKNALALAKAGGLFNIPRGGGGRYQVIGNTHIGGDHTNHVHVGVR